MNFKIRTDSWGENAIGLYLRNKNDSSVFYGEINALNCCAFDECCNFEFVMSPGYSIELQTKFNKIIQDFGTLETPTSILMFVLNRHTGEETPKQPEWFVQLLDNYPNKQTIDWTKNKNHDNKTEVKAYFLFT